MALLSLYGSYERANGEVDVTVTDKFESIVDELRGTCDSLDAVAERHDVDPMDSDLCAAIDAQIFKCAECGWWCEMHEEVSAFADLDEWTCRDCAQANHGYEGEF